MSATAKGNGRSAAMPTARYTAVHSNGRPSPGKSATGNSTASKRTGDNKTKTSTALLQSLTNTFTLSPAIKENSINKRSFDSDPVVNTLRQLKSDDRRDRDMCCGFAPGFRNTLKATWMLLAVVLVWCGFIGLELCKGRPLAPVYVAVQGLCLLAYLGLAEVSGAVAIWKGRRWGVLVLFLSQSLVVLTLMFGYLVLWPLDTSFLEQVQLSNRVNTSLLARVNTSSPSNMTAPSPDCVPAYLTFARVLHGLGHLAVFLALVYSLVACACLVQAAKQRLRVEPPVIDHHAALYRQIESHKRFKTSSRNNKW